MRERLEEILGHSELRDILNRPIKSATPSTILGNSTGSWYAYSRKILKPAYSWRVLHHLQNYAHATAQGRLKMNSITWPKKKENNHDKCLKGSPEKSKKVACQRPIHKTNTATYEKR